MKLIKKILLYLFITVTVIIIGGYLYLFPFGGTEKIVNSKISSLLDEQSQLSLSIEKINGDFFNGMTFENISVYYEDSTYRYLMASIKRVSADYSWRNLINYDLIFSGINIDSADITIYRDTLGQPLIPAIFKPKPNQQSDADAEADNLTGFLVENLLIENSSFNWTDNIDTLMIENFTGELSIAMENNTLAIDLKQLSMDSNYKGIRLKGTRGKLTFSEKNLLFQEFTVIFDDSRIKLNGQVNLEKPYSGEVSVWADNIDMAMINNFANSKLKGNVDITGDIKFKDNRINGSVDLAGQFLFIPFKNMILDFQLEDNILTLDSLHGIAFGDCAIAGAGEISLVEEKYFLEADIKQFDLYELLNNGYHSNLNGHFTLDGSSFKAKEMKLNFGVEIYESQFDEYPIHTAAGDLIVFTDSMIFLDSFEVSYYENLFYTTGKVDFANNINLKISAILNNLDRYREKLFIDQPGGRGFAEAIIDGETSDPDLTGYFISDSLWLFGLSADSFYSKFEIERFLTGKQGAIDIHFTQGNAWNIPYDKGYSTLRIDSNLVYVDTFFMQNDFTLLSGSALYDFGSYPSSLVIDSFNIDLSGQNFYNRGEMRIDIDSNGFIFENPSIGQSDQWLTVNGWVGYNESMDLLLTIKNIPIKPWMALYEDTLSFNGRLSADAYLQGDFNNPVFTLQSEIQALTYQDLRLGDVKTSLKYDDRLLVIDSLIALSDSGYYRSEGYLYADLAFTSDSIDRFPNLPMDIKVNVEDKMFDLVIFFLPSVEEINGIFKTSFNLFGTPQNPKLAGSGSLNGYYDFRSPTDSIFIGANLKYFDLEEYVYTDSARFSMINNVISFDSITVYVYDNKTTPEEILKGGKHHRSAEAGINGGIAVKAMNEFEYDVSVKVDESDPPFPFTYELDDISGKATCDLKITGSDPPLISGEVKIEQISYLVEFSDVAEGTPLMLEFLGASSWNLDIDFEIPAKYWIKNTDINAEFSGEINMERTAGKYKFAGYMEILRGKGYLFDKTFRLDPGGSVFFEGDDDFNPTLDITGYTRIRTAGGLEEEGNVSSEVKKLGVHITGTLEEPLLTPTDDSDFGSNEDIMLAVFANVGSTESLGNMGRFDQRAYDMLSVELEKIFAKQLNTIGVETFEIDPGYSGDFDPLKTRVTVGSYISPNLYIYGRSALSWTSRQEVGFEYRFNKSWMLQGLRDEQELYHLNVRFNLEF